MSNSTSRPGRHPRKSTHVVFWGILLIWSLGFLTGCGERLEEYVSKEGRFRIQMPGTPTKESDPDLPRWVHKVTLLQRSGSYAVAWEDLEKEGSLTDEERLDKACDNAVKALKGEAVSRTQISLPGGYPGRELVAKSSRENQIVRDRMFIAKGRLYQVVAAGPRWWVESPASDRVLDSFRLMEG